MATLCILCLWLNSMAQSTINGIVTDTTGNPIFGANVYLEGTYDGSSTDEKGHFSFSTITTETQKLVVSYLSFDTYTMVGDLSYMKNLTIKLRYDVNALDAVVLSAGIFEAGDNSKVNALQPLDVVTTASALGDFVGALQTLPGTTTVAEDGRLFVRGGEADETQIFIDGIRVFTPYTPSTNNIPTRGRYSPFLFDGITFSTGGYSAEYGQALSSVLLLNTIETPDLEKTDIGIMTVGATIGNTQKWKKNSLSINTSYINLAPYIGLFPDRNDWKKPFESTSGEAVFRQKLDNGLFKFYSAFDASNFQLTQDDINVSEGIGFKLKNNNLYLNGSYKGMLNDIWTIFGGMSYTYAKNKVRINDANVNNDENSIHAKLKLNKRFSSRFKLNFGTELFSTKFVENFQSVFMSYLDYGYSNSIFAAYAETDIFFSKSLALKTGVRAEYSSLFKAFTIAPRVSLAYKTSKNSQLSLAYGNFYQNPNSDILKFTTDVESKRTDHYILNYQLNKEGKMFRVEAYYKNYDNLVKYNTEFPDYDSMYSNLGDGFARGIDVFWRDNRSVKSLDYWLSYSYLDSERNHKNYPMDAQPNFANTHNLSMVGKYWIEDWKSQIGMSYNFASGRTYTNPNETGFLNSKTKSYNSLSLNWAYLISPQKILYMSVNNALGFNNVNGYQYANTPNTNGIYERRTLKPAADQFFFIGFFWTISEDKKSNQLDNL
ncbi:MAG: TonB-dependent receptor [Flavobacteriaceae bacterium]|nr:TonB-dependent receptor [Flavobacteriaceae bacterium]